MGGRFAGGGATGREVAGREVAGGNVAGGEGGRLLQEGIAAGDLRGVVEDLVDSIRAPGIAHFAEISALAVALPFFYSACSFFRTTDMYIKYYRQ